MHPSWPIASGRARWQATDGRNVGAVGATAASATARFRTRSLLQTSAADTVFWRSLPAVSPTSSAARLTRGALTAGDTARLVSSATTRFSMQASRCSSASSRGPRPRVRNAESRERWELEDRLPRLAHARPCATIRSTRPFCNRSRPKSGTPPVGPAPLSSSVQLVISAK